MTKHLSHKHGIPLTWKPWPETTSPRERCERGEVAERSEAGEGPPRFAPGGSRHSARRLRLAATGLLASLLAFMLCSPIAHAQGNKKAAAEIPVKAVPAKVDPGKDAPAADANDADGQLAKVKIERGAGGRKIYKIEGEIVIEGKIQKPEAFYVLQKSGINYDWHELKQDFVPKILDSVTKAPF